MTAASAARLGASLVLASGSPRRRELLALAGFAPRIVVPDVDESVWADESPTVYVVRVAGLKAAAVEVVDGEVVLAADTTVELDGEALAKPLDDSDARAMLTRLSGRTHLVHTAVAARRGGAVGATPTGPIDAGVLVTTAVTFVELTVEQIARYVASGEPLDKAGAYAIQGAAGAFVRRVEGSVTNVVGLPLAETVELLAGLGCEPAP